MRQALNLAWLNVTQILRDRGELASLLVLPVVLTMVFSMAFGGGDETATRLLLTDEDGSRYSGQFAELLAEEDAFSVETTSAAAAQKLVKGGDAAVWVRVREGFGDAVSSGGTGRVEVTRDPTSSRALGAAQVVEGVSERIAADALAARTAVEALARARAEFEESPLPQAPGEPTGGAPASPLGGTPVSALPEPVRTGLAASFPYLAEDPQFEQVYDDADAFWEPAPPVKVVSAAVTPSEVRGDSTFAEGYAQYSLGFTVMFVLFTAVGSAGGILEERENGTLQRLLVTPASKRQILGGKILGVLVTASIEAAILIGLGVLVFRVPWGRDPIALLMVVGAYILCSTGFAVLLSALVRTRGQMSALGTVSAVALAMLGGAYWPIEVVSPLMRRIADFTFTGWAMSGLVDVVARNQGVAAAVTPALVLLGFAVAFFVLGSALLKFE